MRTLDQAYENISLSTIARPTNYGAYGTRQHFAVLSLLRAVPHHSQFLVAVCDAYRQRLPHEFHVYTKCDYTSSAYLYTYETASRSVAKTFLALSHPCDILDLSAEKLQYIPKVVRLRVYGNYIDHVWQKLPQHIQADPEVQTYRRCDEHYNQPWQRTHIDGPAPRIKDCGECQRRAKAASEVC